MKIFFTIIFLPLLCKAQIHANQVNFSADGFKIANNYVSGIDIGPPNPQYSSDTIIAHFGFSSKNIFINGSEISSTSSGVDSFSHVNWKSDIDIVFDTLSKKLDTLSTNYSDIQYYDYPNQNYHDDTHKNLVFHNLFSRISKTQDTLEVYLDSSGISKMSFQINDYVESFQVHSATTIKDWSFINAQKNAFISLIITGNFPLSVNSRPSENSDLLLELSFKKLQSKKTEKLHCYDLLGRKYNLEFLGSDGGMSTYSFRSLSPGVYFVNDGKETVKFLVTD